MPGCPPSCSKVKQQLKQLAAERKKAVGEVVPFNEDNKEKASKDRITLGKSSSHDEKRKVREDELNSPDKYFETNGPENWITGEDSASRATGVSEGKSDCISQKRIPDSSNFDGVSARISTKDSQEDLEDAISDEEQASHGGVSEGKSDRYSQKGLPDSSSSDRVSTRSRAKGSQEDLAEDVIYDEERASRGGVSEGKSDLYSQKRVTDGSSSAKLSVRDRSAKSKEDFESTRSEKSTRTEEDGIRQKISSRSSPASRSQQRTPRDSDHKVSGRASIGSRPRDGVSLVSEGSDFGGSDGESRGRGSRKKAGPFTTSSRSERSRSKRGVREDVSDRSEDFEPGDFGSDKGFDSSRHNPCSSECSFKRLKEEMMRRKHEDRQKAVDDYLLNSGMNYFEDICTCCSGCLAKQLWSDPFVRKMLLSAALFAVGIKLCWEMDAWYLPT